MSARFAWFANMGAAIITIAVAGGVFFAWEYYKEAILTVQEAKKSALEAKVEVDILLKKVESTTREISALRSDLLKPPTDVRKVDDPSNKQVITSRIIQCPEGSYLVGISFQDQAGLAHGALWGPQGTCAKLNVGRN